MLKAIGIGRLYFHYDSVAFRGLPNAIKTNLPGTAPVASVSHLEP